MYQHIPRDTIIIPTRNISSCVCWIDERITRKDDLDTGSISLNGSDKILLRSIIRITLILCLECFSEVFKGKCHTVYGEGLCRDIKTCSSSSGCRRCGTIPVLIDHIDCIISTSIHRKWISGEIGVENNISWL